MYGMVNIAIEQMITEQHGQTTWNRIKASANVNEISFINIKSYNDAITYNLIEAASNILGKETADILEDFGMYWILYTANQGYGDLMKLGGNSLPEFLQNLNMLHFRVGSAMPELSPPYFEVLSLNKNSLTLSYRSKRQGLAHMVVGLLKGLGIKFGTPCNVQLTNTSVSEDTCYTFDVSW
jgi:hypothetical protein